VANQSVMERLATVGLVGLMAYLTSVSGQEPSYRDELYFTPKPVVLGEPITCVADKKADIAFFGEPNTKAAYSSCTVEKDAIFNPLRIMVQGKKSRRNGIDSFRLVASMVSGRKAG
jgi:hypothetical protein